MALRIRSTLWTVVLVCLAAGQAVGQDRSINGDIEDWCYSLRDIPRIDDSAARIACGRCDNISLPEACLTSDDCFYGTACIGSQEEVVWYDARYDSVANDLRTVALAQDQHALYVIVDWHSTSDPMTLPIIQIALDFQAGGTHDLFDPHGAMVAPGVCSVSTDRACTTDTDCHFCTNSFEYPPCCDEGDCTAGEECRVRICGSDCDYTDPTDVCDTSQTCLGVGTTATSSVGVGASTTVEADYLVSFDLFLWLVSGQADGVQLARWTGAWTQLGTFEVINQGPGVPERPPSLAFETAITWDAFGCTGWDDVDGCGAGVSAVACGCPDFGPGVPFRFTTVLSRAGQFADFAPRGAIEDVASEEVAGATTVTTDSCPGPGIGTTLCEIADASTDSFGPGLVTAPGGTVSGLRIWRNEPGEEPSITLRWNSSCSYGDSDYEVYSGNLSSLPVYGHGSVSCSTAGETTATFDAEVGDQYYLVVPTDGVTEGSSGVASDGTPRPQSPTACRPQVVDPSCGS